MTDYSGAHGKFQGFISKQNYQTKPISSKETALPKRPHDEDHTLQKNHMIGKLVHNVYKIQRVLQKTNYMDRNKEPTEKE